MLSTIEIQRRISTTRAIGEIINAMKAYSGVTIRKTEETVYNIRKYEDSLLCAMADLQAHHPPAATALVRRGTRRILVVFGSSQGLCGSYNERVAGAVSGALQEADSLFVVGRRLKGVLDSKGIPYDMHAEAPVSVSGIESALESTLKSVSKEYRRREYYSLAFVFSFIEEDKAVLSTEKILPPDPARVKARGVAERPPLVYMNPARLFEDILQEFLYISLYRCFLESLRSENWYRLRTLQGASQNIDRRLEELRSLQNYARQEEITEEMLEILGGGKFFG
jgi:F-type H+-transporting ATPase subunit gamma